MMRTVTTHFEEIWVKGVRFWKEGGRTRQETVKFSQTVNPFNKNGDGSVKTRDQVRREVFAEREAWMAAAKERGNRVGYGAAS